MANEYCTLAEVKSRLNITDETDDTELFSVIEFVSRWIDRETGREYYSTTATRYFTPEFYDLLIVDDLLSVTSIKTDDDGDDSHETTWSASDYTLLPYNTTSYTTIETTNDGDYTFPVGVKRGVEIVGTWGYAATVPVEIKEATILGAIHVFRHKELAHGLVGNETVGNYRAGKVLGENSVIKNMLDTIPQRLV